jgi:MraZ protein
MDQFVSTFTNRIDTKGRVSVPASFRTVLAKDGLDGIYCYPSLDAPALDAGGKRLVDKINALVEDLAPYSDERPARHRSVRHQRDPFHRSGRTHNSPERLREHAGITTHVTLSALARSFRCGSRSVSKLISRGAPESARPSQTTRRGAPRSGGPEGARE